MNKHQLKVEKRKIIGKKVKLLRKKGLLPANIYGKNFKSTAIQLPLSDFQAVYKKVHETGIVEIELDGQKIPALIKNIFYHYLEHYPLHADFYQVNLSEKIKANIPIVLIGESKAVTEKTGLLLQVLNEIEVEALPSDLPEKIEIDVTKLENIDDQIIVSQIKIAKEVEILTSPNEIITKISAPTKEEVVEAPAPITGEEIAKAEEEGKEDKTKSEESTESPKK